MLNSLKTAQNAVGSREILPLWGFRLGTNKTAILFGKSVQSECPVSNYSVFLDIQPFQAKIA